jgi:hypothetical protein
LESGHDRTIENQETTRRAERLVIVLYLLRGKRRTTRRGIVAL